MKNKISFPPRPFQANPSTHEPPFPANPPHPSSTPLLALSLSFTSP